MTARSRSATAASAATAPRSITPASTRLGSSHAGEPRLRLPPEPRLLRLRDRLWRRPGARCARGSFVPVRDGKNTRVDGQVLRFRLRGGADAVPSARRIVDRVAEQCALPRFGDVRLLVSELVTN